MLPLHVNTELELRLFKTEHIDAFLNLILQNRERLDRWMRWTSQVQTRADAVTLFERFTTRYEDQAGFHAGLWYRGELVGGVACHNIDRQNNKAEIGYWLGERYTGKGLTTQACREVITMLFEREKIHRIEILCMTENQPSRAVAERLGFTFEGVLREAVWVTDGYKDHALYSLLAHEWNKNE
jgi:ribosomal-protein-serine acetyltransferase